MQNSPYNEQALFPEANLSLVVWELIQLAKSCSNPPGASAKLILAAIDISPRRSRTAVIILPPDTTSYIIVLRQFGSIFTFTLQL
jgi:hypothetical protein